MLITHNLSGLININTNNLSGKPIVNNNNSVNYKITFLKNQIVSDYIVPLFSKQWNILKDNVFLIDTLQKSIINFYKKYKLDELLIYSELLKVLKILIDEHNLLEENEAKINNTNKRDPNQVVNMIYKTTRIRLLPEYEIYNSIIGKPDRKSNVPYNETIISDIKQLLTQERITFSKIQDFLEKKYKNK
jgi:hypothetical protein